MYVIHYSHIFLYFSLHYLDIGLLQIICYGLRWFLSPKNNRKCLNDSSNYRAIALGVIVSNTFDSIIMEKSIPCLRLLNYSLVSKQNIKLHNVHLLLSKLLIFITEMTRRVEYNKLFQLLIDRNICPLYARLLINMYT